MAIAHPHLLTRRARLPLRRCTTLTRRCGACAARLPTCRSGALCALLTPRPGAQAKNKSVQLQEAVTAASNDRDELQKKYEAKSRYAPAATRVVWLLVLFSRSCLQCIARSARWRTRSTSCTPRTRRVIAWQAASLSFRNADANARASEPEGAARRRAELHAAGVGGAAAARRGDGARRRAGAAVGRLRWQRQRQRAPGDARSVAAPAAPVHGGHGRRRRGDGDAHAQHPRRRAAAALRPRQRRRSHVHARPRQRRRHAGAAAQLRRRRLRRQRARRAASRCVYPVASALRRMHRLLDSMLTCCASQRPSSATWRRRRSGCPPWAAAWASSRAWAEASAAADEGLL